MSLLSRTITRLACFAGLGIARLSGLASSQPTSMPCVALDDEVEAVVRAAAGRLVLLYLPTYSPWLNPIEMLWRHYRRKVTHCELFEMVKLLVAATRDFFDRYNQTPEKVLSIIGSYVNQQNLVACT